MKQLRDRFGRYRRRGQKLAPPPKRDAAGRFKAKPPKPRPVLPGKIIRGGIHPPAPGYKLNVLKDSIWIDATGKAPNPLNYKRIPKLPAMLSPPPIYSERQLASAIDKRLREAREDGLKHKVRFENWRVGFWFVQPATDGATYLVKHEIRTFRRFTWEGRKGQGKYAATKFLYGQGYADASRVNLPLVTAIAIQGFTSAKASPFEPRTRKPQVRRRVRH